MVLKELVLSNDRRIPSLTPCAGRCSTVFGDLVCRGCRRFNHEVIQWNTYTPEQRLMVWRRLDAQLNQILVPLLPHANLQHIEGFIHSKHIRVLETATTGRKLYHALKICEKNKHLAHDSGLGITDSQVKPFGMSLSVVCWLWRRRVMNWHGYVRMVSVQPCYAP